MAGDFDNDGEMDLIAGNIGKNNFYQPTAEKPVTIVAKDFDKNGSIDPIMFTYFKDGKGGYESYPVKFWGDLSKQSPIFRQKFDFYKDYAQTTKESLLSQEEMEGTTQLQVNFDQTVYVENLGDGKFKLTPLPLDAPKAPINDIVVSDFDKDGNLDLLLVGNDYGNETFIGRHDAFNGLFLKGRGDGSFESDPPYKSGFIVPGDAKALVELTTVLGETLIIATQNRDEILVFRNNDQSSKAN